MISPSQRPLPDNTQHSQQTNIQALGGIRTHNLNRRVAVDLRLRLRGHWDLHLKFIHNLKCKFFSLPAMKTKSGVELLLHSFINLTAISGWVLGFTARTLYALKNVTSIHYIGGCMSTKTDLHSLRIEMSLVLARNQIKILRSFSLSLVTTPTEPFRLRILP